MPFIVSLSLSPNFSRVSPSPLLAWLHKRTSRCIYTRIPTCSPPFSELLAPPVFLISFSLFLSLPRLFQTLFLRFSRQLIRRFCLSSSRFFLPSSRPLMTKSVRRNRAEKDSERVREGRRKRGLNYLPRSRSALSGHQHHHHHHRRHHYHRSQSLLRSRVSTIG